METYLPIIKATLSDWIQLTLNNPMYAAALAIAVWLLCSNSLQHQDCLLKETGYRQ